MSNNPVDGATTIADDKGEVDDPVANALSTHVQKDCGAARAVSVDRVGPRLTHSKIGQGAAGRVIDLFEPSLSVETREADDKARGPDLLAGRQGPRVDGEGVIAFERGICAAVVVVTIRSSHAA